MAYFPPAGSTMNEAKAPTLVHFSLQYNDAAGTYSIPVPAGTFVITGGTFTSQAFDASGATLKIQESGGTHNYMDTTDTDIGNVDTVFTPFSGAGESAATGKYYPTATTIDVVFVPGTGGTVGKVIGFITMSCVRNDGIPAAAAAA